MKKQLRLISRSLLNQGCYMRVRPWVEGLENGLLCLRVCPQHVNPELQEDTFKDLDLLPRFLEKLCTVKCIALRLHGEEDFSRPAALNAKVGFEFSGFADCTLRIGLAPEYVDELRGKGVFYFAIPVAMHTRFSKVKTIDLQLVFESVSAYPEEEPIAIAPVPA
jgi:hypothetical protein